MKKQQMIDQSQKDYRSFVQTNPAQETPNTLQGLRKKNSKLAEINTFKIGGDVREINKKMKYHDYNDNLTLNPTKNYNINNNNSSNINNNITANYNNNGNIGSGGAINSVNNANNREFNIISNNNRKEFIDNPLNHTSNEYKQMINNENFDQYGRQIGVNPINNINNVNAGHDYNNNVGYGNPNEPQIQNIKGIENLENYSPYNDHYNYRPVSGVNNNNNNNNNSNVNRNSNKLIENNIMRQCIRTPQDGYVQDKNDIRVGYNMNPSSIVDGNINSNVNRGIPNNTNSYDNYRIEPINKNINNDGGQKEREDYNNNNNNLNINERREEGFKTTGKKVDLNSIPIPDNVNTVEDYEQYLISLGIDPLSLEYIDYSGNSNSNNNNINNNMSHNTHPPNDFNEIESQMRNLNINDNYKNNVNINSNKQAPIYNNNNNMSNIMNHRNDEQVEKIRNDYGFNNNQNNQKNNNKQQQQQQDNPYATSNSNYGNIKSNNINNGKNQHFDNHPQLPNYGSKPTYKNQSSVIIADASAHTNSGNVNINPKMGGQYENKEYEPFVKTKPLVINPCKFII